MAVLIKVDYMTTTDKNTGAVTGISDLRIAFDLVVLTNISREL